MLETRSEARIAHELPVRIFGTDGAGKPVNETARTLDISQHGARLKGMPYWSGLGDVVSIRHGQERARFRIVWVGEAGTPREGQLGVLCLENGRSIWQMAAASDSAPAGNAANGSAAKARNRRSEPRLRVSGEAQFRERGTSAPQPTAVRDISLNGCYLETRMPLRPGARLELVVRACDAQFIAKGEVTAAHRGRGMGVRFTQMTPLNRHRLEILLGELSRESAASA